MSDLPDFVNLLHLRSGSIGPIQGNSRALPIDLTDVRRNSFQTPVTPSAALTPHSNVFETQQGSKELLGSQGVSFEDTVHNTVFLSNHNDNNNAYVPNCLIEPDRETWTTPLVAKSPENLSNYIFALQTSGALLLGSEYSDDTDDDDESDMDNDDIFEAQLDSNDPLNDNAAESLFVDVDLQNATMGIDASLFKNHFKTKEDHIFQDLVDHSTDERVDYEGVTLSKVRLLQCKDIWALSSLFKWVLNLPHWFEKALFAEVEVRQYLSLIVKFYCPNFDDYDLLEVVDLIVYEFKQHECFVEAFNHQVFINDEASISGVIPRLTTCYSTHYNHANTNLKNRVYFPHKCYDFDCPFNRRKFDVSKQLNQRWHIYWDILPQELQTLDKAKIDKSSAIFELIATAHRDVENHSIFVNTVGKDFLKQEKTLAYPLRPAVFYKYAFESVEEIGKLKKKYLLEPLKEILAEQGKYIEREYWNPFLSWLDNSESIYKEQVKNKSALLVFINFEREKPQSKFFAWFKSHNSYIAQKNFYNAFVDDAIIMVPTFEKIKKLSVPGSNEWNQVDKVLQKLKDFAAKLNKWKRTYDSRELFKKITFSPLNYNVNTEFDEDDVIICENLAKKSASDSKNLYLLLFSSRFLICEIDFIRHNYKVIENPIPVQYLIANSKKKDSKSKSARLNFKTSGGSSHGEKHSLANAKMSKLRIFNIAEDYMTSVIVYRGQDQEWIKKVTEARKLFFDKMQQLSAFKLKYIAESVSSNEGLYYLGVSYPNDVVKVLKSSSRLAAYMLNSTVISTITLKHKQKKYEIIGMSNSVCARCVSDNEKWKKLLSYEGVRKFGYFKDDNVLVLLAYKKLVCLSFDDVVLFLSKKLPKLKASLISKDILDFGCLKFNNFEALAYVKSSSLSRNMVYITRIRIQSQQIVETIVHKLTDVQEKLGSEVNKCDTIDSDIFLRVENRQFYKYTFKSKKQPTELTRFPQPLINLESQRDNSINNRANIGNKSTLSNTLSNSLVRITQSLLTALPVAIFGMRTGETLVVLDRMAVFCNDHGYFSRAEFIEFDTVCCNGAAYQDGHLIICTKHNLEIYKVFATGPRAGILAQVLFGRNLQIIGGGLGSDDSAARVISTFQEGRRQVLLELIRK